MDIEIRTISADEFGRWEAAGTRAFGAHATDEAIELARSFAEIDRTFAGFDGGIVGTTTTRTSAITIPGGWAKLGFVDGVTVLPTHRRRGIMTRMMGAQLCQMRERGEPLAALSASESLIYERFGFGIATWADSWKIPRVHAALEIAPDAGGRAEFVSDCEARAEWPNLHARVRGDRVGMVHYDSAYWGAALWDAEYQRRGASGFFHVAYRRGGRVAGLVSYRIRERTVLAVFLLGEDAEVEAELWRYCFGIDLMSEIHGFNQPTDDPLPWRLKDPRRLERSKSDHMWLRLVDVRAALEARRYAERGDISFRVHDRFCAWNDGVYMLEGGPFGAVCKPGGMNSVDIELGVSDLAAAYLGGVSFSTLARAGRVKELTTGALDVADRLFRTERQPWSMEL